MKTKLNLQVVMLEDFFVVFKLSSLVVNPIYTIIIKL